MRILLTRLSNDRHRLEVVRPDGSGDVRELETRSLLLHDLVHYAVEAEARIARGFWGTMAAGARFDELTGEVASPSPDLLLAESLVGPMQSVWNGRLDRARYVELARGASDVVDDAFVERVLERVRHVWGHWKGTPFHETMELAWPPWAEDASTHERR